MNTSITPKQAERNIKLQQWINFLAGLAFLSPVVQLFFTYTGLSLYQIILLSNISTICIWVFELPTSVLADTTGRKRSLVFSVISHFVAVVLLLVFPSWWGFAISAVFGALYFSFWSGTGQAFLEENLRVLGREKHFGRTIGHFMFLENTALLLTPLVASAALKYFPGVGYKFLIGLDIIVGAVLIYFTLRLKEPHVPKAFADFRAAWDANIHTAKVALHNVWSNSKLRLLIAYRSLGNHVAYFPIVLLPVLVDKGMPDWYAGIIMAMASMATMIANKYTYWFGERYGYSKAWVFATTVQGILCLGVGWLLGNWWWVAGIFIVFSLCDGIWQPAWNHTLVEHTKGISIATTRSIIFSIFALYTTIGKQLLGLLPVSTAFVVLGVVLLLANLYFGRKVLRISEVSSSN